jgi:hypothetical protein
VPLPATLSAPDTRLDIDIAALNLELALEALNLELALEAFNIWCLDELGILSGASIMHPQRTLLR